MQKAKEKNKASENSLAGRSSVEEALRKAEEALRESEKDFNHAQGVAQTGSWRLNVQKNELLWSDETYRIFGVPKKTPLTYEAFLSAVHPNDLKYVDNKWKAALHGEVYDIEHRIIVKGKIKWVREKAELEFNRQGKLLGGFGTVQDITERKRQEERLSRLNRTLSALSNSSRAMMHATDEEAYLQEVCRIIIEDCGYHFVWIGLVQDDEKKSVRPVAQSGFEKKYLQILNIALEDPKRGRGPTGTAILTAKPYVCTNILTDPKFAPWRKEALKRGYTSSLVLPLISDGRAFGALNIYAKETNSFSAEDVNLLNELANDVAFGIISIKIRAERKKIEEALKKAHDELEIKVTQRTSELLEANIKLSKEIAERREAERAIRTRSMLLKIMGKASGRKEFLDVLVRYVKGLTHCRYAGIRVLNKEGEIPYESYIGFSREFWEKENWLSVNSDQCACIRVVRGRALPQDRPCMTKAGSFVTNDSIKFVNGLTEKEKSLFRGVCVQSGFSSIAVIPIRYKDRVIAAIHLADERKNMFPVSVVEFIERLTPLIGEGIHKFDMEDRMRQSHIEQSVVNALMRYSFEKPDIENVLDRCLRMLLSLSWLALESKGCIYLTGSEPETLILKAQKNLPESLQKSCAKIKFGQCLCGKAARERKIQFVSTVDEKHEIKYEGMTTYGHYCVPIMSGQKLLGVINLYLPEKCRRNRMKEDFLLTVSNALATIIERRRAEQGLIQAQKELADAKRLSDIGTLAATVAHELRNPLAAIRMASFNIKRKAQNPLLDKHLFNIEKKISDSDQIINNLLFYSRLKQPHCEPADLYKIMDECIETARRHSAKNKVTVRKNYRILRRILVEADPLQMKELFGNILNNAYDAIPGGLGNIEVNAVHDNDGFIRIHFKDSGIGMDEEHLKRASEPFFTTKAKGTGLGLSVCSQIVTLHNGKIDIESQKGKGTTVNITLPLKRG